MSVCLSIIVPIYNVKKYLTKCLDSIVESTGNHYSQLEVILVDDGSTDGSGLLADEFADRYSHIKVIHQKNNGVAQARNTGIEAARGKWIYLVDSDDWLDREAVSAIFSCIEVCRDADILLFDAVKDVAGQELAWEHFSADRTWGLGERPSKIPGWRTDERPSKIPGWRTDERPSKGLGWELSERPAKNQWQHSCRPLKELQRKVLYSRGTSLAAPWDKVYRASFLRQNHIRFQSQLRVLDDMVFNVEAMGAAERVFYHKKKIYHYRYVPNSITNSFKPDRAEQDMQVWKYLQEYMDKSFGKDGWTKVDKEALRQSYYCRVIKSFSICCRLCFFHQKNQQNFCGKIAYAKEVMGRLPYAMAFRRVKLRNVEWRLKAVVIMARLRLIRGIYWLHRANTWLENRRK